MKLHLTILVICFGLSHSMSSKSTTLVKKVFDGYNPAVIPRCPNKEQVNVKLTIALIQILNVDQKQQLVKVNVWIGMRWKDCGISWNPSDHYNISSVVLPYERIWIPDVSFKDSISVRLWGIQDYTGTVYSDGSIEYNFPTTLEVPCLMDARDFPYDKQFCNLTIGSWIYDIHQLNISTYNPGANLKLLKSHKEWDVLKAPGIEQIFRHARSELELIELVYTIHLKRKPDYYVHNFIQPAVILLMVASIGHLLPFESGEKITFELTVLDSFVWLKLLAADELPADPENKPIIGSFLNFAFLAIVISTFWQVLAVCIYNRGDKEMPEWTEDYLLRPIMLIECFCRNEDTEQLLYDKEDDIKWRILARCIDKIGLIVYLVGTMSVRLWGIQDYTGTVYSDGSIEYNYPTTLEVSCLMNARDFPYDKQFCNLAIGSWIYDIHQLNISTYNPGANLKLLKSHKEWDVLKAPGIEQIFRHARSELELIELVYTIH